ncbi:MAG: ATP-grasp domain-containing protein [Caulobacteraceae bacterium]
MTAFAIPENLADLTPVSDPLVDLPSQAALLRKVFEGADVVPLIQAELDKLHKDLTDAAAYVSLSLLYQLAGQKENGLACLEAGLHYACAFRQPVEGATLRLLAISARGDLMTNTPVELLVEGQPVEVVRLYLDSLGELPDYAPEHDVAIFAIGESDETRPALERMRGISALWPRPMLNDPLAILELSRDRLWRKLDGIPGLAIPPTVRVGGDALMVVARGDRAIEDLLPGGAFPLIVRPVGSHAGKGLERIDDAAALAAYVEQANLQTAYVSRFVDYASADGRWRKHRIVFVAGRPYLAHTAIGDHWMVHYLNAGMAESADKRAEEAAAMARFDQDFALRHGEAFAALHQRLGLDYFAIDCAELQDGSLLLFEADVSMIVHALDPVDLYPYKQPQMQKMFAAFDGYLRGKAAR